MIFSLLNASINDIALFTGAIIFGLVGLYYGAEWLISGASRIATRMGISPLVVGVTVVSFGTSLPEFVVSLLSALEGTPGIAVGNVFGSNIANILLILGITYLIKAPNLPFSKLRIDYFVMILATFLIVGLSYFESIKQQQVLTGFLSRPFALVLCVVMGLYILQMVLWGSKEELEHQEEEPRGNPFLLLMTLVGLVVLTVGARSLVYGAVEFAKIAGISNVVIGGTIVAVGTSMPELFASAVAAAKGHPEIAIGNVLGSNIFNILFVLGVVGVVHPIPFDKQCLVEQVPLMIFSALLLGLALKRKAGVGRKTGGLFIFVYIIFALISSKIIDLSQYYA